MNNSIFAGVIITLLIHGSLAGGIVAIASWSDGDDKDDDDIAMVAIEATLAFKSEAPPPEQPQKPPPAAKKQPVKPTGVSRDEDKKPVEPKDKPDEPPEAPEDFTRAVQDLIDRRQGDADDEDDTWTEDAEPADDADRGKAGQFDGSKHGFAEVSRGDPYMQQLAADVYNAWELPTLEKGKGDAVGCLRLAVDGSVVGTKLHQETENANIDLSVRRALDAVKATRKPGAAPVPRHLELATRQWTCFKFSVDEQ